MTRRRRRVSLGCSFTRVNRATDVPAFSAKGARGQFVWNFGKWIGAVADAGTVHNGNVGGYYLDSTFTNFLFGSRIPIRVSKRVIPYLQTLFGGVHASTSANVEMPPGTATNPTFPPAITTPDRAIILRASDAQTSF